MRKFAVVKGYEEKATIPVRKTANSAGYDFCAAVPVMIAPGEMVIVPTGIKAYMHAGEYLALHIRSSIGANGLSMANGTGIIDADYADNPENEGHIMLMLRNHNYFSVTIQAGERIAQGIFQTYLMTDDDRAFEKRLGGIGSTGV
jgi:dUTP pyrophosphatase